MFCLPFFGTYMFLLNNGEQTWVFNYTMGLFWCLLVTDISFFSAIWVIGSILGVAWYLISGHQIVLEQSYSSILVHVVWVMGVALLFMQRRDKVVAEKLEALKVVGGAIAHEMRTPLATISGGLSILRDLLPKLVKSYNLAKAAKQPVELIGDIQLRAASKIPEHLEVVNRRALSVIDHLLMNIRETSGVRDISKFHVSQCIQQAIDLYPFTSAEKNKILFTTENDFSIKADMLLLSHVFSNLIKNALYYMSKSSCEGQIKIWLEKKGRVNSVHFKDNGVGMSPDVLSRIFEKFYTTNKQGTGIGLAFCRDVMDSFGGEIKCQSVEGEYAEFIISFPQVKVDF